MLFNWVLWQRTSYFRRSDFRVVEQAGGRIGLRTRNHGLLLGGIVFVVAGVGIAWLEFDKSSDEVPELLAILVFSLLVFAFGALIIWASRTQRDTILVEPFLFLAFGIVIAVALCACTA